MMTILHNKKIYNIFDMMLLCKVRCNTFQYNKIIKRYTGGQLVPLASTLPKITEISRFTSIIDVTSLERQIIANNRALVVYNPAVGGKIISSRHYNYNQKLEVQTYNSYIRNRGTYDAPNTFVENTVKIFDKYRKVPNVDNPAELRTIIESAYYENKELSPDIVTKVLKIFIKLNEEGLWNHEYQYIFYTLRNYLENNVVTLEQAKLFLDIWLRGDFTFKPLRSSLEERISYEPERSKIIINHNKSLEEKKAETLAQAVKINDRMNKLFIEYKEDPTKILESKTIYEWYQHIENRSTVIDFTEEELIIYNKLKQIQNNYKPSIKEPEDKYKALKVNSKLPIALQQEVQEKCFLPEDYELQIKNTERALIVLNQNKDISTNDLKILSVNSSAVALDEEGNFKITQAAYKLFKQYEDYFNFKYYNVKPNYEDIMSQIKNKEFFVIKDSAPTSDSITSVAHLSHRTLVVRDNRFGKDVFVRIGVITSTKDDTTIKIDSCQPTNFEKHKQFKDQMLRIPSHFFVVAENEPLNVDLEMTLYFRGSNTHGENITQILLDQYELRKDLWSNNSYQHSYSANHEFIRKLSILFYQNRLQSLQDEAQRLQQELDALPNEDLRVRLQNLRANKNKDILDKRNQRYFSLLPKMYQELERSLRNFESKLQKEKLRDKEKERKRNIEDLMINFELQKKQTQDSPEKTTMTAKEKKEAYLKNKQNKENNNENNNNQ